MKLGRNAPLAYQPSLMFYNYMRRTLPLPPTSTHYYSDASKRFLSDILGNATNGDCTCAAAFHIVGSLIANAGGAIPPDLNATDCLNIYYQLTHGKDTGLDEQTVLNWWKQNGLTNGEHKIDGWMMLDGTNQHELMTAQWMFENIYFAMALPDDWIKSKMPTGDGFTWDVAGPANKKLGHAFCGIDYTPFGVVIDTWGYIGTITWAAIAEYTKADLLGDVYTVLTQDSINKATAKAASGFAFAELQANLASLA